MLTQACIRSPASAVPVSLSRRGGTGTHAASVSYRRRTSRGHAAPTVAAIAGAEAPTRDFPTPDFDTSDNKNYQEAKTLSAKLAGNAGSAGASHVPQRVVVVGGGLAGLACAKYLAVGPGRLLLATSPLPNAFRRSFLET
jgi:hypothetical protein